jgi:hypothetical protein
MNCSQHLPDWCWESRTHVQWIRFPGLWSLCEAFYFPAECSTCGMGNMLRLAASVVWWLACWPLVPEFAGSNPAEAVGFFSDDIKIHSMPSFGGEIKPSVPCRCFTACKRSVHLPWKWHVVRKIESAIFLAHTPSLANRGLSRRWRWSASGDDGGN